MLDRTVSESHTEKWLKAERELAVRGVLPANQWPDHEVVAIPDSRNFPWSKEEGDNVPLKGRGMH